jgi:hypothetical protein
MPAIGRKKGVRRYGIAHGLRLSPTMEYVCREYARKVGASLSDGMRLLLEQAIGQRISAVEEQAGRLARIEAKLDDLLTIGAHVEGDAEAILRILDPDDPDDMAVLAEAGTPRYYEGSGWE